MSAAIASMMRGCSPMAGSSEISDAGIVAANGRDQPRKVPSGGCPAEEYGHDANPLHAFGERSHGSSSDGRMISRYAKLDTQCAAVRPTSSVIL